MDQHPAGSATAEPPRSTEALSTVQHQLLDKLLAESLRLGGGVPADKFRVEHYDDVDVIASLESANHIKRSNDVYVVLPTVLPMLGSKAARSLVADIESIYATLRTHYREHQKTPVSVSTLVADTGLSVLNVSAALHVMRELYLWCSGTSGDLSKEVATVTPSEDVLKFGSFALMANQVRQWHSASRGGSGSAPLATASEPMESAQRTGRQRKALEFATAFETYTVTKQLGEGGAGRVYLTANASGLPFAVKVLSQVNTEKRRRFRNEVAFLRRMPPHANVVTWVGDGFSNDSRAPGPFYVMPAYEGSLRDLLRDRNASTQAPEIFRQILAGVEAAHQQRAVHRDLKPENVLYKREASRLVLAVADFGIAQLHPDDQETLVETKVGTRLANFDYHAPEQRRAGGSTDARTDIFALGLMLNELFTGEVPRGSGYKTIAQAAPDWGYLDELVDAMTQNSPETRPATIAEIRLRMQLLSELQANRESTAAMSQALEGEDASDELVDDPPRVLDARWEAGTLIMTLSRPVSDMWVECLRNRMGSWESVQGAGPEYFRFSGATASVSVQDRDAQRVVDTFKTWLPKANEAFRGYLEAIQRRARAEALERLKRERSTLELTQRVNAGLRI